MPKKILVVDDSEGVRSQIHRALAGVECEVVEASDGMEGLEAMRARQDFAVVLCDVNMPRMSGLEMLAQAKREGLPTPVLMLTTEGQPSLLQRARQAGAKGWIIKPFKAEFLLMAVKRYLA
jgi:two-component system, chemotaxis family, chemotaxis protein CheY